MKILLIVTIFAATAWAGDPFPLHIPESQSICYMNKTISDRYRRMPASLENLVAIIRKVEAHPDTALWTIGKMASTLIHRFRYDGTIDVLGSGPDVVPVTTERVESDKFRIQWKLVPGTASDFPEASLTQEEKCSLHWMLSYTVNHTMRTEDMTPFSRKSGETHDEHHETGNTVLDDMTEKENNPGNPLEDYDENEETEISVSTNTDLDSENVSLENDGEIDFSRRRKRETESPHPLEIGIIHTKYGTVATGSLLMGIAAGSEPQNATLKNVIKTPNFELSIESMEKVVHSIWVATLAGDIAHTSLLRTPKNMENFGPRGQWNNIVCPREYKLDSAEHSMLTNSEFYGGLDGLLLARRMSTWDVTSYLKLSSVLEMYYSESGINGDSKYRACNRIHNYRDTSIIDPIQLKEQSLNAALIMYSRGIDGAPTIKPGIKPADQIGQYVNTTLARVEQFVSNSVDVDKDFQQCEGVFVETTAEPTPATYTDLTFVFDQSTDSATLQNQKNLAASLALEMDIQAGGSRMEAVSGKDGNPFFDLNFTQNRAELACKVANLPMEYSERRVSASLDKTRSRILTERSTEKTNLVAGSNTRSILFFVSTSITAEKDKIKSVVSNMLNEMPDVHIMFATLGSAEELRSFVADFDRDIIKMNQYTKYSEAAPEIAKRLAKVGARLSYPECRDISSKGNTTEPKYLYSNFLNLRTVQYYRLGPENFFSSGDLYLRFQTMYGVARYCVSTTKEHLGTGDICKTAQKAGETIEFKFTQPCGKMVASECSSIYISASPLSLDDNIPCSEKACHTPDQVKFTFSHSGMRCNSAVVGTFLSPLTLAIAVSMSWFLKR